MRMDSTINNEFDREQRQFDRRMDNAVAADDCEPMRDLPVDAVESRLDNIKTYMERPVD